MNALLLNGVGLRATSLNADIVRTAKNGGTPTNNVKLYGGAPLKLYGGVNVKLYNGQQ